MPALVTSHCSLRKMAVVLLVMASLGARRRARRRYAPRRKPNKVFGQAFRRCRAFGPWSPGIRDQRGPPQVQWDRSGGESRESRGYGTLREEGLTRPNGWDGVLSDE